MSKIVFFCIPAHGHTNPTLGVVRELISRGHQVFYYSYNMIVKRLKIQEQLLFLVMNMIRNSDWMRKMQFV